MSKSFGRLKYFICSALLYTILAVIFPNSIMKNILFLFFMPFLIVMRANNANISKKFCLISWFLPMSFVLLYLILTMFEITLDKKIFFILFFIMSLPNLYSQMLLLFKASENYDKDKFGKNVFVSFNNSLKLSIYKFSRYALNIINKNKIIALTLVFLFCTITFIYMIYIPYRIDNIRVQIYSKCLGETDNFFEDMDDYVVMELTKNNKMSELRENANNSCECEVKSIFKSLNNPLKQILYGKNIVLNYSHWKSYYNQYDRRFYKRFKSNNVDCIHYKKQNKKAERI